MKFPDKRAVAVWLSVGVLLLAWTGFAAGANAGSDDKYDDAKAAAIKQQQFWKIVAGEQRGSPGVFGKLANDLNAIPIEDLRTFRGDSNRYGGITDELGFDPFAGENCSECGPLRPIVIDNVVAVRTCCLDQVLSALEPPPPSKTGGAPWFLWLLWAISLPVTWAAALWRRERVRNRRYAEYGSEMELVKELGEVQNGLSLNEANDVQALRDQLVEGIDRRIKYGETEARNMKLEALLEEARETLDSINEGNRALNSINEGNRALN